MKEDKSDRIDEFDLRADAMRHFLAAGRPDLPAEAGAVSGPAALLMVLQHLGDKVAAEVDALLQSVRRWAKRKG